MCWLWHGSLCSGAPPATFAASVRPSAPTAIRNRMRPNPRVLEPPSFRSAPGGNTSPAWRRRHLAAAWRYPSHSAGVRLAQVSPEESPPLGSAHAERVVGSAASSPHHARSEHRRRRPVFHPPSAVAKREVGARHTRSALCKFRRAGPSFCQVDVTPVGGSPFGPWGRTFFLEGPGRTGRGVPQPSFGSELRLPGLSQPNRDERLPPVGRSRSSVGAC